MDRNDTHQGGPAYVIHTEYVVGEDLREILAGLGIRDIRLAQRIAEVPVTSAALVVVAASEAELADTPQMALWRSLDVPVVILDDNSASDLDAPNIARIAQPFRPEDVASAIDRLGALRR
jgi:hypothetical protein